MSKLTMRILENNYSVCRLDSKAEIPLWPFKSEFYSITKTEDEVSIVCETTLLPENVQMEKDWRIFKVLGPLDFSLVGVLSEISTILANAGVSLFAISTYDTDYILVKEKDLCLASKVLRKKNYNIV